MRFIQNVCVFFFFLKDYLILPVSFWFNSATKNMSQLLNKHVQYSWWQTAMKVAETHRIKTFYSYKTTQWSHISQKTFPWSQSSTRILFVSARNTSRRKVIYKWINITDREGREVDTFFSFFFGLFDKQEWWNAALTGSVTQQVIFTFSFKKRRGGKICN